MPRPNKPEEIPILTSSARDYAKTQGRELSSYRMHGPIWSSMIIEEGKIDCNLSDKGIREQAFKQNCEALVDTRYSLTKQSIIASATGLELLPGLNGETQGEEEIRKGVELK
jgi:hypothetical protein